MDRHWEVRKKAQSGDKDAMMTLGANLYADENIIEALYWFEKASKAGYSYAERNLVQLYARNDMCKNKCKFFKRLEILAYDHYDGWGMVVLGTILCGQRHGLWDTSFPNDNFDRYFDVNKGIRLIEKGISITKEKGEALDHFDYNAIAESYYYRKRLLHKRLVNVDKIIYDLSNTLPEDIESRLVIMQNVREENNTILKAMVSDIDSFIYYTQKEIDHLPPMHPLRNQLIKESEKIIKVVRSEQSKYREAIIS